MKQLTYVRLTTWELKPCTSKQDWSETITSFHSSAVLCAHLRAQCRRIVLITELSNCFYRLSDKTNNFKEPFADSWKKILTTAGYKSLRRSTLTFLESYILLLIITLLSWGNALCFLLHHPCHTIEDSTVSVFLFETPITVEAATFIFYEKELWLRS